jgi:hypothetical protein
MPTFLGLVGATIAGAVGWWLGESLGLFGAFLLSTLATGLGYYYGRRLATDLLG